MNIPSKGQYALCALFAVAYRERKGPVSVSQLALELDISLSYLEQLFAGLRNAGLVRGRRGAGGGYRLARDPSRITVLEVLRAVGAGQVYRTDSDYLPEQLWSRLSESLASFLEGITVEQVLRSASNLSEDLATD